MDKIISLKNLTEKTHMYYIETYDHNYDVTDIIKLSSKLVQKYGGRLYLGSDPGNLGNPFALVNSVDIYFSNGFMLKYNANNRMFDNGISYFQSILYFRKRKLNIKYTKNNIFTSFGKQTGHVFFELYNIDYEVGKEEETFYFYNVNSEISKAPCGFHMLTLSTLEDYAKYISKLNVNNFKLSRKPWENWGILTDKKILFSSPISKNKRDTFTTESSRLDETKNNYQNSSIKNNLDSYIDTKILFESDILFDMNQEYLYIK